MKGIEDCTLGYPTLQQTKSDLLPRNQSNAPLTIAYLVNVYPKVSHSFIRREIHALETQGFKVARFSIRPAAELVDPADRVEAKRTEVLLAGGFMGLAHATLAMFIKSPGVWLRSLGLMIKTAMGSERGVLRHCIYFAEACALGKRLNTLGVTHLHAHFGTNPADVAMYTSSLTAIPYSFSIHGPEEFDRPIGLRLSEKISHARFVVAVSSFGRSQLYRWIGHDQWPKVQVMRCGLDADFFTTPPTPVPRTPRLVCIGRLCEQKGQLLLIKAAAKLAQAGHKFELILIGDGDLREPVERLIIAHHLEDQVTITGWQSNEQVRAWLRSARALVLPSFAEGLPVVIMEALAMGRPVISTYIAGIPELLTPECGWLLPAGSVDALAAAMVEALQRSTSDLDAMGQVGVKRVQQFHNAASETDKLAQWLNRNPLTEAKP